MRNAICEGTCCALALLVGCNGGEVVGSDAGDASGFPLGAYDNCFLGTFLDTPGGGGVATNGGTVTLAQAGSVLTATYHASNGGVLGASLEFTQTSGTSATLLPGQEVDGIELSCAPKDFAPSVTQLASGALTYNAGTLFLSVVGTAGPVGSEDAGADDAAAYCWNPGGQAALAITCGKGGANGGGGAAGPGEAMPGSDFVGTYPCQSLAMTSGMVQSVGGGSGTLTITETGGELTAAYTGDSFVHASLAFVPTTSNAAAPATPNETMQVLCISPDPSGGESLISLPVTSSTLTIDGRAVVLSLIDSMPSSCYGTMAETAVSLFCEMSSPDQDASPSGGGGDPCNHSLGQSACNAGLVCMVPTNCDPTQPQHSPYANGETFCCPANGILYNPNCNGTCNPCERPPPGKSVPGWCDDGGVPDPALDAEVE